MQNNKKKGLRDFISASDRRKFLEQQLKIDLSDISNIGFTEASVSGRNIENLIGATQIPLGVAGPLKVKVSKLKTKDYYIPLATTEGALVASISRGCKAIAVGNGAVIEVENVGISRGPVFKTSGIADSLKLKRWIEDHFELLCRKAAQTSSHITLLKTEFAISGRNVYVRFLFDTSDAMGMNMVTITTQELVTIIEHETKAKCISLAGNFDIDKKPAWLNFISGRGRRVWAEIVLSKKILQEVLKVSPEQLYRVVIDKTAYGSIMSGSIGFNAHFANIVAAIFIASGQDLAHVVEGSLGVTSAEILPNGDLYFAIYLPSLIMGTVGGGTTLPSQQQSLKMLGVGGGGKVDEFAKIVGATVLAGELSLLASLAVGSLAISHKKYARKGR